MGGAREGHQPLLPCCKFALRAPTALQTRWVSVAVCDETVLGAGSNLRPHFCAGADAACGVS